jgi:histidyl-tRNA synthetase
MADKDKLKAESPRGFADRSAADIRATDEMVARIRRVYERYGFEPVETPLVEYTESLGKFLPDLDRPNEGVFSFRDEGDDDTSPWLSLRYDLTAPLARYVAANYERLSKPYRSYRFGWVFRNEKPGPGRFRQFMQFDADTVGSASPAADAEMCMMAADTLEELGIPRGQYVIKVNSRKVLDGVMEAAGVTDEKQKLTVLRAIDKLDRLGTAGVRELLGPGRKDESGDFTKGAGLSDAAAMEVLRVVAPGSGYAAGPIDRVSATTPPIEDDRRQMLGERTDGVVLNSVTLAEFSESLGKSRVGEEGLNELTAIDNALRASGYGSNRVMISPGVVRGLEYYTGAVFEAELLAQIPNEKGQPVVFGSVGGGGRYDGLVGRFMKEEVPATGFSIGVSRLQAALTALGKIDMKGASGPVVVLVMDKARVGDYQKMVADLRRADVPAELYLGAAGMKAQMKYADKRDAPLVVIQGGSEITNPDGSPRSPRMVQIKDMRVGEALSAVAEDRAAWTDSRKLSQQEWQEDQLVEAVNRMLGRGEPRP